MGKLLDRFCAKEVQILLTRIRERPEDFNNNSYNIWQRLVEHGKHYTWIERKLIDREMRKMKKVYSRKMLLARILDATVNPKGSDGDVFEYTKPGQFIQPNSLVEHQRMQTEMARQMMNSASPNPFNPYQNQLGQHANYHR